MYFVRVLSDFSQHMDPVDREKAGFRSRCSNALRPPTNPAATVFVQNVSLNYYMLIYWVVLLLCCHLTWPGDSKVTVPPSI